ncbi:MAG: polysaccharide biosynthesis protein [Actinobacteria bacterium]|nr:polysaccharide biosynthesis protein [Actinomycetota bacterium]
MNARLTRTIRSAIDIGLLVGAYVLAFELRFEFDVPQDMVTRLVLTLPYVVLLKYLLLHAWQVDRYSWRYTSLGEVLGIAWAMAMATGILMILRSFAPALGDAAPAARHLLIPWGVLGIDVMLVTILLIGARAARRMQVERRERVSHRMSEESSRALLIGAGRAGVLVARELTSHPDLGYRPLGFVDDDPAKQRALIHGVPVLGTTADLPDLVREHAVDEAIITMANVSREDIRRIVELCDELDLPTKIVPGLYEIVDGQVSLSRIRPVAIEDLLGRDPVDLDISAIESIVADDVVVVTGAGGSIGAELCRQLARFRPRQLVLVERAENALFDIHRDLGAAFPELDVVPCIADVCDTERIDQVLLHHRPTTVFHAAAHKHVPMMEANAGEAVKNNIAGTRTLADLALERGVHRFVLISSDKAVNPTSVMGATKRVAERYVQHLASTSGRPYVSVRFGNVLGSAGSVIPIFNEQIAAGGPVTVTDAAMQRYFMTIPEAAKLVLQAAAIGEPGEILVLDMGDPVRIVDLAEDLIRLSGFTRDEIEIEFTGLRPGEKMFEEIALDEEHATRTRHPKVWIGHSPEAEWSTVEEDLVAILALEDTVDPEPVREVLRRIVPEYDPDPIRTTDVTDVTDVGAGEGSRRD